MRQYLTAIRFVNLCLLFATQFLLYYFFFQPIRDQGIALFLWPDKIWIFLTVTLCIAACGYLINDYFDFETDRINKKRLHCLSKFDILKAYYTLLLIGFGLSVWLAVDFGPIEMALLYILAQMILFIYGAHLKSTVLTGNILVSAFATLAIWIFFLAENEALDILQQINPSASQNIRTNVIYIGVFIFLLNLIRELIKDIEDMKGDKQAGLNSLAIIKGKAFSMKLSFFLSMILLTILTAWGLDILTFSALTIQNLYFLIGLLLPMAYLSVIFLLGRTKNFKRLQQFLKLLMLSGLIFIVLHACI